MYSFSCSFAANVKPVLLTENLYLSASESTDSPWSRVPVSQFCFLLHVLSLALVFHSLSSSGVLLWKRRILYIMQPCCDILFLVGYIHYCAPGNSSRLSNAGFISKGRLFWIQWLWRICILILSTSSLDNGVLSVLVENGLL